jgi:1-acyl-sn-glycerol-3-phosphate acyltransferase
MPTLMIPANHTAWAHALFRPYVRNLCRRRFHGLRLLGAIPAIPREIPILLAPNHSTWWDGFFPYLLNERLFQREYYIMMLEHKLREFPFFRRLGAFSINQQSPKGIVETLHYTSALLQRDTAPLVIMFPQGELRPHNTRPLGYTRGIERVLKQCSRSVAVVPLGITCEFLGEERPFVFMQFGEVQYVQGTTFKGASVLERTEEELLAAIDKSIIAGERGISLI